MKIVRLQLDIQYQVPDNVADHFHQLDHDFFKQLENSFWQWAEKPGEVRIPTEFDFKSAVGDVEEQESNKE